MNHHGWGLRMELVFIIIFLICLLIATLGLNRIGINGDSNTTNNSYYNNVTNTDSYNYEILENNVSSAALKYYQDKYNSISIDTLIVSLDTLKNNGYITHVLDEKNKECSGYVKILSNGNCISYIKCSKYKTSGYDSNNE